MTEAFINYLKNILFIDIETAAQWPDFESVDPRFKPHWERKAYNIKNEDELPYEELYSKRAALYPEFGKVICIGFGGFYQEEDGELRFRVKSIAGHDEKDLLEQFSAIIARHPAKNSLMLCAHNGKEFDYPFLGRRMLVNQVPLPDILTIYGKKPWDVRHLDTMELWKFGDFKSYITLDLLAALFDVPSSKQAMDGSMVSHIYHIEQNLGKIQMYCLGDVVVLMQLYLRLHGHDLLNENQIEYV